MENELHPRMSLGEPEGSAYFMSRHHRFGRYTLVSPQASPLLSTEDCPPCRNTSEVVNDVRKRQSATLRGRSQQQCVHSVLVDHQRSFVIGVFRFSRQRAKVVFSDRGGNRRQARRLVSAYHYSKWIIVYACPKSHTNAAYPTGVS